MGDPIAPVSKPSWQIYWLPKGYGPTPNDFTICLVPEPPGADWSHYGFGKGERPPLIEAICEAIEAQMIGGGPI